MERHTPSDLTHLQSLKTGTLQERDKNNGYQRLRRESVREERLVHGPQSQLWKRSSDGLSHRTATRDNDNLVYTSESCKKELLKKFNVFEEMCLI